MPASTPAVTLKAKPTMKADGASTGALPGGSTTERPLMRPTAMVTPATPPSRLSVTASATNWLKMLNGVAPMALRMPISRTRSLIEASMRFMMPMPLTSSDTPAMALPPITKLALVLAKLASCSSLVRTLKSMMPRCCWVSTLAAPSTVARRRERSAALRLR